MDFPQGARVLNVSIDLAVRGRDAAPKPPVEAYLRVIDEPVLRLVSVDLAARADITSLPEVFDFAKDYLGLLKAAVIASGIVPPGTEGSGRTLAELLARVVGPGLGLEIVSNVNNIPKGSRLAVSTNLLGSLISACMRATGQAKSLTGPLLEEERRLVAARAILGEWIGGSGGGWQDSGGVWPGMKLIHGSPAREGDPEFGVSRGRLLPTHKILDGSDAPAVRSRAPAGKASCSSTAGWPRTSARSWRWSPKNICCARQGRMGGATATQSEFSSRSSPACATTMCAAIGAATTRNFFGPLQAIIPWASNHYTETLIARVKEKFGDDFWGFWMLGGMSGGGMGFIFAPHRKQAAQEFLQELMSQTKQRTAERAALCDGAGGLRLCHQSPRHIRPASAADDDALLPAGYYAFMAPQWLRTDPRQLSPVRRAELDRFGAACRSDPALAGMVETLFDRLLPRGR